MDFAKSRILKDVDEFPEYTTRRQWGRILCIDDTVIRNATYKGVLEGDLIGNRWHHTKKQILRWFAPSLYREKYEENLTRVKIEHEQEQA
jgi:hypothetical protein